jgi:uncharacterized protein (TIGR02145 family)
MKLKSSFTIVIITLLFSSSFKLFAQDNFITTVIGDQVWMAKNLDVVTFNNGDLIPEAKTEKEWKKAADAGTPAWCYYDGYESNGNKYGKMYNWYAITDSRGLAPKGWKIPQKADWEKLINKYQNNTALLYSVLIQGGLTGLNVLLGGRRLPKGEFQYFEIYATLWCASLTDNGKYSYYLEIDKQYTKSSLREGAMGSGNYVRCIKE